MNYSSTILVQGDVSELFADEPKDNERSSYTIENKDGNTLFTITAKDSVSLRATLNSITKLLTVYEKLWKKK